MRAGYERQRDVFEHHPDWNKNSYKSNENGNAPFSFDTAKIYARAFGVRAEWLYDGNGGMKAVSEEVPVIGRVGADAEGLVLFSTGQASPESVPSAPGGAHGAAALMVVGDSMHGFADNGALIYFNDQRTSPTEDMAGHIVVVETGDGRVLIKRLQKGSATDLWNLESTNGPTIPDVKIQWIAYVTAIIPPYEARRIFRRGNQAA